MNTTHPLDDTILDFGVIRRRMLRLFLRDNQIDADERAVLDAYDDRHDELADYRRRQVAAHSLERNGVTKRTRAAFREAGMVLDFPERQPANVIRFPTDRRSAG